MDPFRRSLIGEPWKRAQTIERGSSVVEIDKIPFRNASIVSKILSGDSNEDSRLDAGTARDISAPVTSLGRDSAEDD